MRRPALAAAPPTVTRTAARVAALAAALVATLAAPAPVRAGNFDAFFLGNEAAMTGGAVLAATGDAGATWYNPAGLGRIDRDSVDLSASAFVLQIITIPDMIAAETVDGERFSQDGVEVQLRSVPTALVMTRRLTEGVTGSIGVFVPTSENDQASADFVSEGTDERGAGRLTTRIRRDEEMYYFGAAVGWAITPRLRLGGALFAVYYAGQLDSELTAGLGGTDPAGPFGEIHTTRGARLDDIRFGVQGNLGLQWQPADDWHVGLVVRSPMMQVYQTSEGFSHTSAGGANAPQPGLVTARTDVSRWGFDMAFPVQVALGVAWSFGGGWVSAEASVQPPLDSDVVGVDFELLWNLRAGARFRVSDVVSLGAGFFTDRSPFGAVSALGDFRVDYYGVAVGAEFRSAHALSDDPDPDALVFTTTIGLRYALGIGEVGTVLFVVDPSVGFRDETYRPTDVVFHELTLHIGSGVLF